MTVEYRAGQYITVDYRAGQYMTVQDSKVQDRTGQSMTVKYRAVQYRSGQYMTVEYRPGQYTTVQDNAGQIIQERTVPEMSCRTPEAPTCPWSYSSVSSSVALTFASCSAKEQSNPRSSYDQRTHLSVSFKNRTIFRSRADSLLHSQFFYSLSSVKKPVSNMVVPNIEMLCNRYTLR